jgi:hypothetical protein
VREVLVEIGLIDITSRFVIGFRALGRQKEWYYLKRVSRKSIGEADDPLHEKK